MDPCECVDIFNTQVLIGHILNLVNSQTDCTDNQCFTSNDVGGELTSRIDPGASFSTFGVALMALLVLVVILPMNVRRRNQSSRNADPVHKQSTNKHHNNDNNDNGPDMAM